MCRSLNHFIPNIPHSDNWSLINWENDDWGNIIQNDDWGNDGWNTLFHTPNDSELESGLENFSELVEDSSLKFYACAQCYCPIVSMDKAIFDVNIGLICGVFDVKYGNIVNPGNNVRHYERQVECFGCHDVLTFVYDVPDNVRNYESVEDIIIFDLRNIVSGVTMTMYLETLEEPIDRDSRIYDISDDDSTIGEVLISVNTIHTETVYEISSDED